MIITAISMSGIGVIGSKADVYSNSVTLLEAND